MRFATHNICDASILKVLYPKQLKYLGVRYDGFAGIYWFDFDDPTNAGPSALSRVKSTLDILVPARGFRRALIRLHEDFKDAQRRSFDGRA